LKRFTIPGGLAVCGLVLVFPIVFSNPAVTTVAVFTLLFAVAAAGWNIFSGYTGYISLGHAAYYGLGTYLFALFCQVWNVQGDWPPFLLVPLVGLVTAIVAMPLGWLSLKTRRYRFLMLSIVIFVFSAQVPTLLEGTPLGGAELSLPVPSWSGETFNEPFYYVACALLALALFLSWWIRRSKYGLVLLAIRDDEDRVRGLGVRTDLFKLSALLISAALVSMVGALSAYFISFVAPPSAFDPRLNIVFPLLALFGGAGTPLGPVLGAFVLVPLQQNLTIQFGEQGWDLILYGAVFLVVVLLLPEGVLPALQKKAPVWGKIVRARLTRRESSVDELVEAQFIAPTWEAEAAVMDDAAAVVGAMNCAPTIPEFAREPDDDETDITEKRPAAVKAQAGIVRYSPDLALLSVPPDAFSPTQRLRAARLVGVGQRHNDQFSQALPDRSMSMVSLADQRDVPGRGPARTIGGVCPRCQAAPLRAVGTMVFCRRCGMIVAKEE
jgi:branched-chain amino acid transport system permease protein